MDAKAKEAKKEQQSRETAIFVIACTRLKFQPTEGAQLFGVSRPTFWSWTHGRSKVPKKAFVRLIEIENGVAVETWQRLEAIKEIAKKVNDGTFKAHPPKAKRGRPRKKQTSNDGE